MIVQAGVKGYDIVTYDVTYVNEIETDRVETGRITTAVVDEIVRIGTRRITITSEGNDGIVLTGNTLQLSGVEECRFNNYLDSRKCYGDSINR